MSVTRRPTTEPDPDDPERGPQAPLSAGTTFWYSAANLGCGAFFSFNNFVLPLFLKQYTHDARLLGLMASSHSVEGAVLQPIVGSISDRMRTRFGRRRPFMLLFLPLSALFMLLTPAATTLPLGIRLSALVALIFLFTVTFNIAFDPYQAWMPDITPEAQRGRVWGVWALLGNAAQAGILLAIVFLHLAYTTQFVVLAGLMVTTTLLTCFLTPEPHHALPARRHPGPAAQARIALKGLATLRQAGLALLVFAVSGVGIGAVTPNLTLFIQNITDCSDDQAFGMIFVLMIVTTVGVAPFGWLTDRIGPKAVTQVGLALIGAASLAGLILQTLPQVTLVMCLAGLGNAAQAASNYPLLTDLTPAEEVGFYTGFQSTMLSIAQPVAVVLTGALINHGHGSYRWIFVVCAISIALGMLLLTRVDPKAALAEIAARDREQGRTV